MLVIASCALAASPPPPAAPAEPQEFQVAHSALLAIEAAPTDDSVALYIKHVADQTAVNSSDVVVTVDGKAQTISRAKDGSYLVSAAEMRDKGPHTLEITVSHDGIREILSGQLSLPSATEGSFISAHRQIGWWILNIGVVLIAAIALSRRRK
ncbi:MAG TPA: hypothetical protein VFB37_14490 [Steroidobacteraceae bacterium]|nr:hypothetical protein [Steroidobacteraceae bacterium]